MKLQDLSEETVIPENAGVDEILKMLDAVHRALSILKRIKDPHQRLKHALLVHKNFIKISDALLNQTELEKKKLNT